MKTRLLKSIPANFVFLALFSLVTSMFVSGSKAGSPSQKFEILRSSVRTVASDTPGRAYQIFVKTPRSYHLSSHQDKRYPVVYLNDGAYTFQVASGVMHFPAFSDGRYDEVILVGISYAVDESAKVSRTRDLTPAESINWTVSTGLKTGGADTYLKFLENRLMPYVEHTYRIDPNQRTLGGHSFGGLFALWVLFKKPRLFKNYIISSPSLWYNRKMMFDVEKEYASQHADLDAVVYFGTGTRDQMGFNDLAADQSRFVTQLKNRNYSNLKIRDKILEGVDHATAFPINFARASRWMFHSSSRH